MYGMLKLYVAMVQSLRLQRKKFGKKYQTFQRPLLRRVITPKLCGKTVIGEATKWGKAMFSGNIPGFVWNLIDRYPPISQASSS